MKTVATTPRRLLSEEQRDPDTQLSASDLAELRAMLEARKTALLATTRAYQRSLAENKDDGGDEADQAAFNLEAHLAQRRADNDQRLLAEVERAIAKFSSGEYGLCEATEEPIGVARLRAQPWARFSAIHQEERERRERALLRLAS